MCGYMSTGKWKEFSPAADVLMGIGESAGVGLPVVLNLGVGVGAGLLAEIRSGCFPKGRSLAVFSHAWMSGPGVVSGSSVDVELCDRIAEVGADAGTLVPGKYYGSVLAECVFEVRMREREDRCKYDWTLVPKAKEALSLLVHLAAEIVMVPKEGPSLVGTSVDAKVNGRSRNTPPCIQCAGDGVENPVGLEPADNIEVA